MHRWEMRESRFTRFLFLTVYLSPLDTRPRNLRALKISSLVLRYLPAIFENRRKLKQQCYSSITRLFSRRCTRRYVMCTVSGLIEDVFCYHGNQFWANVYKESQSGLSLRLVYLREHSSNIIAICFYFSRYLLELPLASPKMFIPILRKRLRVKPFPTNRRTYIAKQHEYSVYLITRHSSIAVKWRWFVEISNTILPSVDYREMGSMFPDCGRNSNGESRGDSFGRVLKGSREPFARDTITDFA